MDDSEDTRPTRRRLLSVLGAVALGGLAGCSLGAEGTSTPESPTTAPASTATAPASTTTASGETPTPEPTSSPTVKSDKVESVAGTELPVGRTEMVRGAKASHIPAVTDPAFASDWSEVETTHTRYDGSTYVTRPRLMESDPVIGVARDGRARAYPLRIVAAHEIVNDDLGGPLIVTYCFLCASGMVAGRTVRGEPTTFGVSGLLWKRNLVMFDERTQTLWSQLAATAIRGPLTGTTLTQLPASMTTWGEWRRQNPETQVLLPPPLSDTMYSETTDTVGVYTRDDPAGDGPSNAEAFENGEQTQVLGVSVDGVAKAYPMPTIYREGLVNDAVNGRPVVVVVAPGNMLVAYDRAVNGSTRRFELVDNTHMRAGGSRWALATGRAVDGPHAGRRLTRANDVPQLFWRSWNDFHPDTQVYGDWTPGG